MEKKYFGTDGIRGLVGDFPVNAEFVLKLGWAVGRVLAKEVHAKVLIGKDTRISGYMFESALEAGLSAAGVDTYLLGPMPTPAIAYLTRTLRANAGIVISASHNAYHDNGIKFFSPGGFKLSDELEIAIEDMIEKPMTTVEPSKLGKVRRLIDATGRYIEFCKSTVSSKTSFSGFKIVLDCANGATYHVAPHVFHELGADVIEICTQPNGFNINKNCGSTNTHLLQKEVIAQNADLGIAFDGDGDRVIMVDNMGEIVDGDELVYIIAKDRVTKNNMTGGVVGTQMTNLGLEIALKQLGVDFLRTNVGDRYVLSEMVKQGWSLGGESSGHIICLDHTTTGDGIISALQVLVALYNRQKSLHEWKKEMQKFPQVMINVEIPSKQNPLEMPELKKAVEKYETKLGDNGRILLRASGTEPVIRIMVEGEDAELIKEVAEKLADIIKA